MSICVLFGYILFPSIHPYLGTYKRTPKTKISTWIEKLWPLSPTAHICLLQEIGKFLALAQSQRLGLVARQILGSGGVADKAREGAERIQTSGVCEGKKPVDENQ